MILKDILPSGSICHAHISKVNNKYWLIVGVEYWILARIEISKSDLDIIYDNYQKHLKEIEND